MEKMEHLIVILLSFVSNKSIGDPSILWEFVWEVMSLKLPWNKWTKSNESYQ